MRTSELRGWLEQLEESRAPEPSPVFVAKLEADLQAMDQAGEANGAHRRPARRTRRTRLLVAAGPVAALTAAAAAAAVTLLPGDPHPRRVTTADPGVTAPALPASPDHTPQSSIPTTVTAPPWLPSAAAPPKPGGPTTTAVARPAAVVPAAGPADSPTPPVPLHRDPVTTTVPRATTTTAPAPAPETLSLHCTAGMSGGNPTAFCGWSQSTSPAFKWYRLWRESAGSPPAIVFQSDNRSTTGYYDHGVQSGTNYYYKVDITDGAGNVIGTSSVATAACC